MQGLLDNSHQKFIDHVKRHRGNRLKVDDKIFSGEVFTGEEVKENGLVDEVGSMVKVLGEKYPGARIDYEREDRSWKSRARNVL